MLIRTPDFQSPKGLEVDRKTLTATYGRFSAEPFSFPRRGVHSSATKP